ncbi:protein jagunal homolog 1-A [Hydra vulgaris]|uniref:Protein jagunal homolog 1-A n=1 Tax=Hydra vulgaris TaxID=6087 RepID=A0ABM4CK16_HYDVU
MASRSGPRAEGTDGSDFSNRESIASHYKKSAALKTKVRKSMIPHILMTILLLGKFIVLALGYKYFLPFEKWEMVWVLSGISAFVGLKSLAKNDNKKLSIYIYGNILFGIAPLIFGLYASIKKVQVDMSDFKNVPDSWRDSPMKMAIIACGLTWQIVGIFHALRLRKAWSSMDSKNK